MIIDSDEERISNVWQMYEKASSYQQQIGLQANIPRQVDFYEGRQWNDSANVSQLPKPVINIIKMIVRNKRAGLLSSPVRLEYMSSDDQYSGEEFTAFAEYIAKEIKQAALDAIAVLDGAVKGTYAYHYYWNPDARGLDGRIDGGMQGEVIDSLNIFFANPCEKDEQKQEWIIIANRIPLSAVKELAERGVADMESISPDERSSTYTEDMEPKDAELCTVLTRYFRIEGEVYYEKAVKGTMLHAPHPINPYLFERRMTAQSEDGAIPTVPTEKSRNKDESKQNSLMASYYPIAIGTWDERNNCIYGISEVESLMPNQKLINFTMALYCLAVQNVGWGKYIVSDDALGKQTITNEPGQVLVDYSKLQNGIRRMNEPAISQAPLSLVNLLIDQTRSTAGATEVMSGEQISSNMSGAAIAQLQSQAQKPIEEMRERFWRVKERIGKIYEQFFKLYYDYKEYTYQGNEALEQAVFNGGNYSDISFSVVVEAGAATQFSEPMMIANLEQMLAKEIIDAKTFVKLYPKGAMPNRTELLKAIEEQEMTALKQMQQQIESISQEKMQMQEYIESQAEQMKKVSTILSENERLKNQLIDISSKYYMLEQEATLKINQANQAINEQNNALNMITRQGGGASGMQSM